MNGGERDIWCHVLENVTRFDLHYCTWSQNVIYLSNESWKNFIIIIFDLLKHRFHAWVICIGQSSIVGFMLLPKSMSKDSSIHKSLLPAIIKSTSCKYSQVDLTTMTQLFIISCRPIFVWQQLYIHGWGPCISNTDFRIRISEHMLRWYKLNWGKTFRCYFREFR